MWDLVERAVHSEPAGTLGWGGRKAKQDGGLPGLVAREERREGAL